MGLNESIQESIRQNLPALAANELSSFIKQAEADAKELERLRSEKQTLQGQILEFNKKEAEFNTAVSLRLQAESVKKTAEEKEAKMELVLTQEKLVQRDFVINKFEGFLSLLVKNPRAIEIIAQNDFHTMGSAYDPNDNKYKNFAQNTMRTGSIESKETKSDNIHE